jgi:small multidrug resistance pump
VVLLIARSPSGRGNAVFAGVTRPFGVAGGRCRYLASFILLTLVLRTGMPVGVAYGIWGACGTAATAVLAAAIYGDPFTWPIAAGIGLIIAGVLLVEFGSQRAAADES